MLSFHAGVGNTAAFHRRNNHPGKEHPAIFHQTEKQPVNIHPVENRRARKTTENMEQSSMFRSFFLHGKRKNNAPVRLISLCIGAYYTDQIGMCSFGHHRSTECPGFPGFHAAQQSDCGASHMDSTFHEELRQISDTASFPR